MIDVISKTCQHEGCTTRPNKPGEKNGILKHVNMKVVQHTLLLINQVKK